MRRLQTCLSNTRRHFAPGSSGITLQVDSSSKAQAEQVYAAAGPDSIVSEWQILLRERESPIEAVCLVYTSEYSIRRTCLLSQLSKDKRPLCTTAVCASLVLFAASKPSYSWRRSVDMNFSRFQLRSAVSAAAAALAVGSLGSRWPALVQASQATCESSEGPPTAGAKLKLVQVVVR